MAFLNFPVRFAVAVVVVGSLLNSCKPKVKTYKSPPHYNFGKEYAYKLDTRLVEISGITYDTKQNAFLAIQDESDTLYFLDKENLTIKSAFKFGDPGDYEDIALYNGHTYILRSDGTIFQFFTDSITGKSFSQELPGSRIGENNDFESMYADTARKALVVICKNCKADDGSNSVSAFAFYPDSIGYDDKPLYKINSNEVEELSPKKSGKFQPSGAAVHPKTGQLYILSSATNEIAISDLDGNVQSVYRLSPKLFPQPEGIAFRSDGDMCISNEGLKGRRKATLLKFEYIPTTDSAIAGTSKLGYDINTPSEKMELGKHLHEISGMAYIAGKNVILAENDEKGSIYSVDFKDKVDNAGSVKFGGKGDYEDIVHTDTAVYMLVSPGAVVKVDTRDSLIATQEYTLPLKGKNEFETMYMDADKKTIIMLCKQCDHEKDEIRAAYGFDPKTNTFTTDPVYTIDIKAIQKMLNDDKAEFKPSAAGINPVTGKLFIVASVGKLLVIADPKGKVEEVFRLDPVMFNQPEGLTFAPNGDLYISNEGGEGIATILKFNYRKK